MLTLIDEYTRECLAIRVARRLGRYEVIEALADVMLSGEFRNTFAQTTVQSSWQRSCGDGRQSWAPERCTSSLEVPGRTAIAKVQWSWYVWSISQGQWRGSGGGHPMKSTVKLAVISVLLLAYTVPCFSQSTSTPNAAPAKDGPLPSVDEIAAKSAKGSGGKEAWAKLSTLVMTGTMEIPAAGLTGKIEVYSKAPNKT